MFPSYTETLAEFLQHQEGTKELQDIQAKFALFPKFNLYNLDIDMWAMFKEDNLYREIGAETEHLFMHYLNRLTDNLLIKYVPKISIFIAKFNELFDRKVKLVEGTTGTYFLNPMQQNNTENLIIQDVSKYEGNKEQAYSYFKSNPQIMKEILELQDIYNNCLEEFSKLFMGVL